MKELERELGDASAEEKRKHKLKLVSGCCAPGC